MCVNELWQKSSYVAPGEKCLLLLALHYDILIKLPSRITLDKYIIGTTSKGFFVI